MLYTWVLTILVWVRHVGRLLDGHRGSLPLEFVKDGDLILLIERMLHLRGLDTVRITKVKGHADEGMVLDGRVRELDRIGNNAADEAADIGRMRVGNPVIDARRNLSGVCGRWYPVILDLHWFFIAISRAVVNHDGRDGTAPVPLVWSAGALPKRRRLVHAVRDPAFCLGHLVFGIRNGLLCLQLPSVLMTLLIGPTLPASWLNGLPFLGLCIGLLGWQTLGLVVSITLNCSFFMSCNLVRGCLWEKAHPCILRPGRLISVSAAPFGPGIDIWRSCRFIGVLMMSLCLLPGGLGRFVPCSIGANHCRLSLIGWER